MTNNCWSTYCRWSIRDGRSNPHRDGLIIDQRDVPHFGFVHYVLRMHRDANRLEIGGLHPYFACQRWRSGSFAP